MTDANRGNRDASAPQSFSAETQGEIVAIEKFYRRNCCFVCQATRSARP